MTLERPFLFLLPSLLPPASCLPPAYGKLIRTPQQHPKSTPTSPKSPIQSSEPLRLQSSELLSLQSASAGHAKRLQLPALAPALILHSTPRSMNRLFIDYKSATGCWDPSSGTLPVGLYKVFISSPPSPPLGREGLATPPL